MIYMLYTNSDLIEGKGVDILIGVSTNLEFLKELAYKIPCSMGYSYPQAEIYGYEDDSKTYENSFKVEEIQTKTSKYPNIAETKEHWYLSGLNGKWYNNFEDYWNARQNYI